MKDEHGVVGLVAAIFLTLAVIGLFAVCTAVADAAVPPPNHQVTLCHRTGSASNPYVQVTVDIASSGYVQGGHDQHEQVGSGPGGDIIPAYTYTRPDGSVFNYPGKNLGNGGAAILANGCVVPPPPTTGPTGPPPPTTGPTGPTAPPTTGPTGPTGTNPPEQPPPDKPDRCDRPRCDVEPRIIHPPKGLAFTGPNPVFVFPLVFLALVLLGVGASFLMEGRRRR